MTDGPPGPGTMFRSTVGDAVTVWNELTGHGVGRLLEGFATRATQKDARIKAAVESRP